MVRRKGQIMGMPLVFIIILVFMALVLLFGYRAVQDVWHTKDMAQLSTFILHLEDEVEVIYNLDIGSGKAITHRGLPKKITHVCFVNPGQSLTLSNTQLTAWDRDFAKYLDVNTLYNVYILPTGAYPKPAPHFRIPNLLVATTEDNPLCFATRNGAVNFALESQLIGNDVVVMIKPLE